jgi:hypothetical protein
VKTSSTATKSSSGPRYQCSGKARRGQRASLANPEVLSSWVDKDVADLADVVTGTPQHDVVHHYAGSHPGAQIAEDKVVPCALLSPALAGGRSSYILVHQHMQPGGGMQISAESDLFPTGQLGRFQQYPLDHIERTRRSDPKAEHCRRLDPGGRD